MSKVKKLFNKESLNGAINQLAELFISLINKQEALKTRCGEPRHPKTSTGG
jgi:hypothetical protein